MIDYGKLKDCLSNDVEFSSKNIAEFFCNLNCQGMAKFFNEVGEISNQWDNGSFPMQMHYVQDSDYLKYSGRYVMGVIGEYSYD